MILPLPLAGEGWGEGGLQIYPLTLILSPQRRGDPKVSTFKKLLTAIFSLYLHGYTFKTLFLMKFQQDNFTENRVSIGNFGLEKNVFG